MIDLGNGLYYGHGIGKFKAEIFIDKLNRKRKKDAEQSAFLTEPVGRPNFKKLYNLYVKSSPVQSMDLTSA